MDVWYAPDVLAALSDQRWKCDVCKTLIDVTEDDITAFRATTGSIIAVTHRCWNSVCFKRMKRVEITR